MSIKMHIHCVWDGVTRCFQFKFGDERWVLRPRNLLKTIELAEKDLITKKPEEPFELILGQKSVPGNLEGITFSGNKRKETKIAFSELVGYLRKVYDSWVAAGLEDGQYRIGEG